MLFSNGALSFPEMMFFSRTINRQLGTGWGVDKAVVGVVVEEVVVLIGIKGGLGV